MPKYQIVFTADTVDNMKRALRRFSGYDMSGLEYHTLNVRVSDSKGIRASAQPQKERGSWVGFDG